MATGPEALRLPQWPEYSGLETRSSLVSCVTHSIHTISTVDPTVFSIEGFPIIWGQEQSYLVKQLHDYRSGDRDNQIMAWIEGA